MSKAKAPRLSACGNPYIGKGNGNAVVQSYIDAMPGWKRAVGKQFDALVEAVFPQVKKQVRWNTPFYGKGDGWLLAMYCYKKYVQLSFLTGSYLDPMPPITSKVEGTRYLDVYEEDELDKQQLTDWVRQAFETTGQQL